MDWQTVDRKIARAFPAVEFVSNENLLAEQQLSVKPTIIDVRLPEEYDVSHIPKAHNLQSADAIAAAFPDYAETIIVSCSVGYRSAAVAEDLAFWAIRMSRISGIRFLSGQSVVMIWKTPPASRQGSIHSTARGGLFFPKSCMTHLDESAPGKLFPPGLRLILHKPVSSDV